MVAPRYAEPATTAAVEVLGVPSVPMPLYPEIRIARPSVSRVLELIRRFRPDLVHCETEFGIGRAGQAAAARAERADGLVLSHRLRPIRRGVRRPLAAKAFVARYIARFHAPQPAGLHAVERVARGRCCDSASPTWRSGAAGWTPSSSIPVAAARSDPRGARDGEPVHLPLRRAAGLRRSASIRSWTPSGWRARCCREA